MNTFEMNNARKDVGNPQIKRTSPVVEVFSAMVNGRTLPVYNDDTADKAVAYIKDLASKAGNGDMSANAELNQIRREILEPAILEEMKLLELFGSYTPLGADETVEREIWDVVGGAARIQALNGNVRVPAHVATRYTVAPISIGAGYQIQVSSYADSDGRQERHWRQVLRRSFWYLPAVSGRYREVCPPLWPDQHPRRLCRGFPDQQLRALQQRHRDWHL